VPSRRVLIVQEATHARVLQANLEQHGYRTCLADSALDCDGREFSERFDAILMDTILPDCDGVELCRHLRRDGVGSPILMMSTIHSVSAKVEALDAGADEYLTRPLELAELLARLRSLLRRSKAVTDAVIRSEDLVMDLYEHRVTLAGSPIKLTAKEFALLHYMMRNPRRLLTRTMIHEEVWDVNYLEGSNVIDVYVSSLRRKVDRDPHRRRIETVIGSGYRFVDRPVTSEARMPMTSAG